MRVDGTLPATARPSRPATHGTTQVRCSGYVQIPIGPGFHSGQRGLRNDLADRQRSTVREEEAAEPRLLGLGMHAPDPPESDPRIALLTDTPRPGTRPRRALAEGSHDPRFTRSPADLSPKQVGRARPETRTYAPPATGLPIVRPSWILGNGEPRRPGWSLPRAPWCHSASSLVLPRRSPGTASVHAGARLLVHHRPEEEALPPFHLPLMIGSVGTGSSSSTGGGSHPLN